ncbi:Hypothetical predicted protein, partial [Xyrichtys novacula]
SSSQAALTLSGTDSTRTKEFCVCWPETTGCGVTGRSSSPQTRPDDEEGSGSVRRRVQR